MELSLLDGNWSNDMHQLTELGQKVINGNFSECQPIRVISSNKGPFCSGTGEGWTPFTVFSYFYCSLLVWYFPTKHSISLKVCRHVSKNVDLLNHDRFRSLDENSLELWEYHFLFSRFTSSKLTIFNTLVSYAKRMTCNGVCRISEVEARLNWFTQLIRRCHKCTFGDH